MALKKGGKSKGKKGGGKATTSQSPGNQKLNHSLDMIEAFSKLKVSPPPPPFFPLAPHKSVHGLVHMLSGFATSQTQAAKLSLSLMKTLSLTQGSLCSLMPRCWVQSPTSSLSLQGRTLIMTNDEASNS